MDVGMSQSATRRITGQLHKAITYPSHLDQVLGNLDFCRGKVMPSINSVFLCPDLLTCLTNIYKMMYHKEDNVSLAHTPSR